MKKFSVLLSLLIVTSVFLAACGGGKDEKASSASSAKGKTTITVASWNAAADALTEEIAGFNKKYPNIEVNVLHTDTSYSKITPALAAGSGAPDIIQTQARDFPAFQQKFPGQFVDITDKTKKYKDDFSASSWKSVTKDNKVYGMPWDIGPTALYYRKDLFEKAGIDVATIKTWDDFNAAGKKLTEAIPGTAMTLYTDDFNLYEIFLNQLGGSYVKDGKINVHSPESKQALLLQKKMKDEGIAINVHDGNGRIPALTNDKVATVILPVWYAGTLSHSVANQAGKWGIVPIPAFKEGGNTQANLGGSILAVSKQSKNPDAAFKFIEYCLTTDEGQKIMLQYGLFPSYTPFYKSAAFNTKDEYFGTELYPFFAKQTTTIKNMEYGPIMLDATKPLKDMIDGVLAGNDADQMMKTAAESISKSTKLKVNN